MFIVVDGVIGSSGASSKDFIWIKTIWEFENPIFRMEDHVIHLPFIPVVQSVFKDEL